MITDTEAMMDTLRELAARAEDAVRDGDADGFKVWGRAYHALAEAIKHDTGEDPRPEV